MRHKMSHVCRSWDKMVCLLHTQHTLDPGLRVVQQIWFEILLFNGQKFHFLDSDFFPSSGLLHSGVIQWHYKEPQLVIYWGYRLPGSTTPVTHLDKVKTVVQLDIRCSGLFAQLVLADKWVSLFLLFLHLLGTYMTGIISIKIKNTRNYVTAVE
jgi:hypothetical protein